MKTLKMTIIMVAAVAALNITAPTAYSVLVSFEGSEPLVQSTKNAFISKEGVYHEESLLADNIKDMQKKVFVSGNKESMRIGNFVIRDEKHVIGKSYVSRPSTQDIQLARTLHDSNVSTLENYVEWLSKNVKYRNDKEADTWSSPRETLEKGYGDCEDYAFLNESVLRLFGYEAKVMGMVERLTGEDHAFCAFRKDGIYYWFDNSKLKKTEAQTEEEFATHIAKKYLCKKVVTLNFASKTASELASH